MGCWTSPASCVACRAFRIFSSTSQKSARATRLVGPKSKNSKGSSITSPAHCFKNVLNKRRAPFVNASAATSPRCSSSSSSNNCCGVSRCFSQSCRRSLKKIRALHSALVIFETSFRKKFRVLSRCSRRLLAAVRAMPSVRKSTTVLSSAVGGATSWSIWETTSLGGASSRRMKSKANCSSSTLTAPPPSRSRKAKASWTLRRRTSIHSLMAPRSNKEASSASSISEASFVSQARCCRSHFPWNWNPSARGSFWDSGRVPMRFRRPPRLPEALPLLPSTRRLAREASDSIAVQLSAVS
mmetsp:Transcript_117508/g.337165  ORF Transcript_117508/g.337165 Transcript_117508/m.337165 type:complete len:298 (-) Transcript_117508:1332-2225(-)